MTSPPGLLFVGNSFVARNDVPGLVAALARTADLQIRTAAIIAGGASLRRHHNGGRIAVAIAAEPWRYVVLQEQSTLPLKNRARYHENVRAVRDEVLSASAAAAHAAAPEIVLYGTWARRAERGRQADLDEAVATIAAEIGARVAPAGPAWSRALADHPALDLYDRDGSHPNAAGSFLAACAIALTLFPDRRDRITAPIVPKLDAATSALLLDAARAVA